MANSTVGVKLDEHTRTRLKKLGEAKQRSTHWLMKDAISRYLDTEERHEREKLEDQARWQRYLETGIHFDQDETLNWLDDLAEQAARKANNP